MDHDFSAKEPSLGYFYQVRYALYLLLSSRQHDNPQILIEALDDIEIRTDYQVSLLQTKYHLKRETNLADRSSDFWKTIRVWSEQINANLIKPDETIFSLVTTETISNNSIMKDIKNKTNTELILDKLSAIATETSNATNKKGYAAFNLLSPANQKKLIKNMYITDASLDFNEIDIKIKNELKLSALPNQIVPMLDRLEGWFFRTCIVHLQGKKDFISFSELQKQINHIGDSFKNDNLPIDFPDKIQPTTEELKEVCSMVFYKQLDLVGISPRLQETAISNYYRAFSQRSIWLKDDLLNPQEEIDFDKRLIDDWQQKFDLLLDDTDEFEDHEKKEHGKLFYQNNYVRQNPNIFIRDRFQENYLTSGSYHMLSDKLKVGWHPDFESLIKADNDS